MSQRLVFLVLLCCVAIVAAGLGLRHLMSEPRGTRSEVKAGSGAPAIGGSFELVDAAGTVRSDSEFRGRFMLVFFGYTHCPDVCPTTLFDLTQALERLGPAAEKIQPIFITVDPLRDTSEAIGSYLENFHPAFIGLTGTRQQLAAVERLYAVYAKAAGAETKDGGYLVDHTALAYLMGPDGMFRTFIAPGGGAEGVLKKIKPFL